MRVAYCGGDCGADLGDLIRFDSVPEGMVRSRYWSNSIPLCEITYAFPMVGDEGMLACLWYTPEQNWFDMPATEKWLVGKGGTVLPEDLLSVPVEVCQFLAKFLGDLWLNLM